MNAEEYQEREIELAGWPARVTIYRIRESWICKVDNISPGATIARATGANQTETEDAAIRKAERRLRATRCSQTS